MYASTTAGSVVRECVLDDVFEFVRVGGVGRALLVGHRRVGDIRVVQGVVHRHDRPALDAETELPHQEEGHK
jgi:hypothetical protein